MTYPDWFEAAWPAARFDAMRAEGDLLADAAIAVIMSEPRSDLAVEVRAALAGETRHGTGPSADDCRRYLSAGQPAAEQEHSLFLPDWVDGAALDRAETFMAQHGARYSFVLLFLSLPILYGWAIGGAQTLAMTGQLADKFGRRVSETLRFVVSVIREGGLSPAGDGIATTLKVRLMHASIRYYARRAVCPTGDNYWRAEWGEPINQEQLVATMLSFCTLAVDGMRKLGIAVTDQEDRDLMMLWRAVGWILGIRAENMPTEPAEGRLVWDRCVERNFGPTGAAKLLTDRHIDFIASFGGDTMFATAFRDIDAALMRYLIGSRIAAGMLGVPWPGWRGMWVLLVLWSFHFTERIVDNSRLVRRWMDRHGNALLIAMEQYWARHEDARPFHIPTPEEAQGGLAQACPLR